MSTNQPPPPPSEPPYGEPPPPQAGPPAWDLGEAISYGWRKFTENVAQILLAALVFVVAIGILLVVGALVLGAITGAGSLECDFDENGVWNCERSGGVPFLVGMFLNLLFAAVLLVVAQIIGAGLIRGALGITEGREFNVAEVFKTDKIVPVVITSLIVGAATFVGLLLCYLPGLVIAFATSYSLYFVLDKDLPPVEAIKASVNLVKDNLGPTIIWYIVGGLIAGAGAIACGVGMLLTVPLVLIGTAWTYKVLTGQPVAA